MKNPIQNWRSNGNPFGELQKMQSEINRLFEEIAPWQTAGSIRVFSPRCEVVEDEAHFELKFDLPGLKKEQIKVEADDNVLTVSAERESREEKESGKGGRKRFISEVAYGSYYRSIALPANVDAKTVKASYENGVLTVTAQKSATARAKQIPVQ